MSPTIKLYQILILLIIAVSCNDRSEKSTVQSTRKCETVRPFKEVSNDLNNKIASLSICEDKTDLTYNISIQTGGEWIRNDVPFEGNLFVAKYHKHIPTEDTILLNFNWIDSAKLLIVYSKKLNVFKQQDSSRNVFVTYKITD